MVAAAISRWASAVDGLMLGFLHEPGFAGIIAEDLRGGAHRNPTRRRGWFTTAYFHHPTELREEVAATGFATDGPVAVEGVARLAPDIDALLDDPPARSRILDLLRTTEREPHLLGVSGHLLIAGHKPH